MNISITDITYILKFDLDCKKVLIIKVPNIIYKCYWYRFSLNCNISIICRTPCINLRQSYFIYFTMLIFIL